MQRGDRVRLAEEIDHGCLGADFREIEAIIAEASRNLAFIAM
jgi:hypothetical protein